MDTVDGHEWTAPHTARGSACTSSSARRALVARGCCTCCVESRPVCHALAADGRLIRAQSQPPGEQPSRRRHDSGESRMDMDTPRPLGSCMCMTVFVGHGLASNWLKPPHTTCAPRPPFHSRLPARVETSFSRPGWVARVEPHVSV
jgi:hypothetical protein